MMVKTAFSACHKFRCKPVCERPGEFFSLLTGVPFFPSTEWSGGMFLRSGSALGKLGQVGFHQPC